MSTYALVLVLSSAFMHSLWNALLKREPDIAAATVGVLGVALISSAVLVPVTPGAAFPTTASWSWALGAGAFEGGYFVSLAMALLRAPLGFAYTVARGTAIALVFPLSVAFLAERITLLAVIGVFVLYLGLLTVGFGSHATTARLGLRWSITCGVCVAGYHLCYKEALDAHALAPALFAVSLAVAFPLNLLWLGAIGRQRLLTALRTRPRALLWAGFACTASFVVFLNALALAGAGVVLTLRNTSIIFAQLMAVVIGERPRPRQIFGACLVAAGATLIGWP